MANMIVMILSTVVFLPKIIVKPLDLSMGMQAFFQKHCRQFVNMPYFLSSNIETAKIKYDQNL